MKLKLLFLFLILPAGMLLAQDTIRSLIITEAKMDRADQDYVELTNMGDDTLNLKDFEFGRIDPWTTPEGGWPNAPQIDLSDIERLPDVKLAPGESFVMATMHDYTEEAYARDVARFGYSQDWPSNLTKKEMWELADLQVHVSESNTGDPTDSVSIVEGVPELSYPNVLGTWFGADCWFIRYHSPITGDSMVVDQIAGLFSEPLGNNPTGPKDAAGVEDATGSHVMIRNFKVKKGNTTFVDGIGLEDSEWIPIPLLTFPGVQYNERLRAAFWTVGNHLDQKLDETTLTSSTVEIDWDQNTLTIPWGIRNDDSIMSHFDRVPGLAWHYDYAPSFEDSAYVSARTGDILTVYAVGTTLQQREFTIQVLDPPASANMVIPKYHISGDQDYLGAWIPYIVTEGVPGMDTISEIPFACRKDSLFEWLEKAPDAEWEILWVDETPRPDLKYGDRLLVTADDGSPREYFLKLNNHRKARNANLSSITWPDIPPQWKGIWGWNGDTIPGFDAGVQQYNIDLPAPVDAVPALVGKTADDNASLKVKRATTLLGAFESRITRFSVTAENDTTFREYSVRMNQPPDPDDVQPWKESEPFFSQIVFRDQFANTFMEIVNPSTDSMIDMSYYMIYFGWSEDPNGSAITSDNTADDYDYRYSKYIPGRIWGDTVQWQNEPRIAYDDSNVKTKVYPGDVFVIAEIREVDEAHANPPTGYGVGNWPVVKEIDINLGTNPQYPEINCPWESPPLNQTTLDRWTGADFYLYKILNDSVRDGTKAANDPRDFRLLDVWGGVGDGDPDIAGEPLAQINGFTRKPHIYNGNTVLGGSFGTSAEDSEWIKVDQAYFEEEGVGYARYWLNVCDGLGSHIMDPITFNLSTVNSAELKVSPGYSLDEEILGSREGYTVDDFLSKIFKKDTGQVLVVTSGGVEITGEIPLTHGDSLLVTSANGENVTRYLIEVTPEGSLSRDVTLVSDIFTISTDPPVVGGFDIGTPLRDVVDGVQEPEGSRFTVIDSRGAFVPMKRINFDTMYVDIVATDSIFFEVVAEAGDTTLVYQLQPNSTDSDAYVTSDVFLVNQEEGLIEAIPDGMAVEAFKLNLVPAPGATIALYDKGGFERTLGVVAIDDILTVTARDGVTTKSYYLGMLVEPGRYLAFVTSGVYTVDQEIMVISNVPEETQVSDFLANLNPTKGAVMELQDHTGTQKTDMEILASDDVLQVISGNGVNTVFYTIEFAPVGLDETRDNRIRVYPNPSGGLLYIDGAEPGQRIRVHDITGVILQDITVDSGTEVISLENEPGGVYLIIISSGKEVIGHYRVIKQ